ncbi:MAG: hypothetical protein K6F67_07130 [Oscillospiraceae bacterium]|nr:hypothetical protein [Oscillospiraceae bacterium]
MSKEEKKTIPDPGDGISIYTKPEDLPKLTREEKEAWDRLARKIQSLSLEEFRKAMNIKE